MRSHPPPLFDSVPHLADRRDLDAARQLKARLRPMRGLKRHCSARVLAAGHAFVQSLRQGHYDMPPRPQPSPAPYRLRRPRAHHV